VSAADYGVSTDRLFEIAHELRKELHPGAHREDGRRQPPLRHASALDDRLAGRNARLDRTSFLLSSPGARLRVAAASPRPTHRTAVRRRTHAALGEERPTEYKRTDQVDELP
jgi:hypothetical protein